jgi:uncharacterized protein YlxW (UPF0749 family)
MSGEPDARSLVSARLLVELVGSPLDPGYAAAAKRRDPGTVSHWYDRVAVAVGCLLVGFLLVVAYVHAHRSAPAAARVHDSLVSRVRSAQHTADALSARLDAVERQLASLRAGALPDSGALAQQLAGAELAVGLLAVDGPGMTVTLSEPATAPASPTPGRGGSTPIEATNILTDRDVRSVVNELWHDGAEAVAVNGVRLTPTSAIRFAGQAVLVDFQPITSPYRISAIGDANQLVTDFAQSEVASRYQTLKGVDGIGFSFDESQHVAMPAGAPLTPRYARVATKRAGR